jgi:hypothetical protein
MSSSFQGTYLLLLAYFNSLYSLFLSSSPRLRQRQTSGSLCAHHNVSVYSMFGSMVGMR